MTDNQAKTITRKKLRSRDKRLLRIVLDLVTDEHDQLKPVMYTRSWEVIGDFFNTLNAHMSKMGIAKPGFMVHVGHPHGEPFDISLNGLKLSEVRTEKLFERAVNIIPQAAK